MESFVQNLPLASNEEVAPYLGYVQGWYESLKPDWQEDAKFSADDRLRWANVARFFHEKTPNIDGKLAAAAVIYEYCCYTGQMKGADWADIRLVAEHFDVSRPRLVEIWRLLLQVPNKYALDK